MSGFLILAIVFCMVFVSIQVRAQTTVITNPYSSTISTSNTASVSNTVIISNCLDLSYDLYQGLSDKANDKAVTNLQKFLKNNQYLSVTPNGYFGPATKSAVKMFQLKNDITNTGRVGPQTRQAIRNISCQVQSNTASVIQASVTPKIEKINSNNTTVSNPSLGTSLRSGTKTLIEWRSIPNAIYDIKLEDKNGTTYGFIATSISGSNYVWEVGKLFSTASNSYISIEPGSYRVVLVSSNYSSSNTTPEQYGYLFNIVGKTLEINSIIPSTISNQDDSFVSIYGTGFDSTTNVSYRAQSTVRDTKPEYISSDGKILVFRVPAFTKLNDYSVSVYNTYSSGATSTPSNALNLTIKN